MNIKRHQPSKKTLDNARADTPQSPENESETNSECDGSEVQDIQSLIEHGPPLTPLCGSLLIDIDTIPVDTPGLLGTGDISIPGFTLERVLGHGSSSVVYLAHQHEPERRVAIKVLRPLNTSTNAASRMRAEAHLLARMDHPSIAKIYQVGVIESRLHAQPFIVMEYVQGVPLSEYIRTCHLTLSACVEIILEVCRVIEYAHQIGVVHRDIKPSNILVNLDEQSDVESIVVIDFGIAKLIQGESIPVDIQTLNSASLGTLLYMSPERRNGTSSGDTVASDLYSIGVLAKEIIVGGYLDHEIHLDHASVSTRFSMHPDLPKSLTQVIERMTHDDPAMRYASVQEAADILREMYDACRGQFIGHRANDRLRYRFRVHIALLLMLGTAFLLAFAASKVVRLNTQSNVLETSNGPRNEEGDSEYYPREYILDEKSQIFSQLLNLAYDHSINGQHKQATRLIAQSENSVDDISILPTILQHAFYNAKGYIAKNAGFHQDAMGDYIKASNLISLDGTLTPSLSDRWTETTHGIQSCGDHEKAKLMYIQLISHASFQRLPWLNRCKAVGGYAGLCWLEGDSVEAEKLMSQLLESAPDTLTFKEEILYAEKLSSLGVIRTSLNKLDEAIVDLIKSDSIIKPYSDLSGPFYWRVSQNLALAYLHNHEYDSAQRLMSWIHELWNANPDAFKDELAQSKLVLGLIELARNNPQGAIVWIDDAMDICSKSLSQSAVRLMPLLENARGEALCLTGNTQEGVQLIQRTTPVIVENYGEINPWTLQARERTATYVQN